MGQQGRGRLVYGRTGPGKACLWENGAGRRGEGGEQVEGKEGKEEGGFRAGCHGAVVGGDGSWGLGCTCRGSG